MILLINNFENIPYIYNEPGIILKGMILYYTMGALTKKKRHLTRYAIKLFTLIYHIQTNKINHKESLHFRNAKFILYQSKNIIRYNFPMPLSFV